MPRKRASARRSRAAAKKSDSRRGDSFEMVLRFEEGRLQVGDLDLGDARRQYLVNTLSPLFYTSRLSGEVSVRARWPDDVSLSSDSDLGKFLIDKFEAARAGRPNNDGKWVAASGISIELLLDLEQGELGGIKTVDKSAEDRQYRREEQRGTDLPEDEPQNQPTKAAGRAADLLEELVAELGTESGQREFVTCWAALDRPERERFESQLRAVLDLGATMPREFRPLADEDRIGHVRALFGNLPADPFAVKASITATFDLIREEVRPQLQTILRTNLQESAPENLRTRLEVARAINAALHTTGLSIIDPLTKELCSINADEKRCRLQSKRAVGGQPVKSVVLSKLPPLVLAPPPPEQDRGRTR